MALPGYQAFDAVDTSNCKLIQQYNVGDRAVPNTGTSDISYDSSEEGVAMYGNTLYFADTGNDTVAVIDAATLNPDNYANPAETLIHVGINPQDLAVTPDGSQVWVADTGPQTGQPSLSGISVISAASDTVTVDVQPADRSQGDRVLAVRRHRVRDNGRRPAGHQHRHAQGDRPSSPGSATRRASRSHRTARRST